MKKFLLLFCFLTLSFANYIVQSSAPLLILDRNSTLYWKGKIVQDYTQTSDTYSKILDNVSKFLVYDTSKTNFYALTKDGILYQNIASPTPVKMPEIVSDMAMSGSDTVVVGLSGSVYIKGGITSYHILGVSNIYQSSTFIKIPTLSNIKQVCTGLNFSLALDKNGNVYGWGTNMAHQLGFEDDYTVTIPKEIDTLPKIKKIACGEFSSYAINEDGNLYEWGYIIDKTIKTPTKVDALQNIVDISAGNEYLLALDGNGNVYAMGKNDYGQLGTGDTNSTYEPVKLPLQNIIDISAGYKDSSFAVANDGSVYGWGKNENNIISDNDGYVLSPVKLNIPFSVKTDPTPLMPEEKNLTLKEGWNLVSWPVNMSINPADFFKNYLIWEYKYGTWFTNSDIYDLQNIPQIDTINPGEGFWIYVDNNETINYYAYEYDLNNTDILSGTLGWSLLGNGKEANVTDILNDDMRNPEDRKIFWIYQDGKWKYYTQDENLSEVLNGKYETFNGIVEPGEGFWVYTDGYLYDYRKGSFYQPAYNDNMSTLIVQNSGNLNVYNFTNGYISSQRSAPMSPFNYTADDNGSYIYTVEDDTLKVLKNDTDLPVLGEYYPVSNGNLKYIDGKLWLMSGSSSYVFDVSDPNNIKKVATLPGFYFTQTPQGYFVTTGSGVHIYDQNMSEIAYYSIPSGNAIGVNNVLFNDDKIIIGYNGYQNYPDDSTYLSGINIAYTDNSQNDVNITYNDRTVKPFATFNDLIYAVSNNNVEAQVVAYEYNGSIVYSYNYPNHVYSFFNEFTDPDKQYLYVIDSEGDGSYIDTFDGKLNHLSRLLIDSGYEKSTPFFINENTLLLIPPYNSTDDYKMYVIKFDEGKAVSVKIVPDIFYFLINKTLLQQNRAVLIKMISYYPQQNVIESVKLDKYIDSLY